MLKENQYIELQWRNNTRQWYENFGYKFTKTNDPFTVSAEHLSRGARAKVIVICDYCSEKKIYTEIEKSFNRYIQQRESLAKDCCVKCIDAKRREISMLKNGVDSPHKTPERRKQMSESRKLDFTVIEDFFSKTNCILTSTKEEFKNSQSKIRFICNIHTEKGEQSRTWANTQSKRNAKYKNICKFCTEIDRVRGLSINYETVVKTFERKGYQILNGQDYIDSSQELSYICLRHPKEIQQASYNTVRRGLNNCTFCFRESISGSNSSLWRGGMSSEVKIARGKVLYNDWRMSVLDRDNYTCQCCNIRGGKLNVHHIENFADNKDIRYSVHNGITLCESHHLLKYEDSFHRIYGSSNNDIHQLQEYFDNTRSLLRLPPIDIVQDIIYKDYIFEY